MRKKFDSGGGGLSARSLTIVTIFTILSTWNTLYNKYIFENVFPSSNCLLLVQNIFTVIALLIGRSLKIVQVDLTFTRGDVACGMAYSTNVMAGLWSLMWLNIAVFGVLKRVTLLLSWGIETYFTPKESTHDVLPSLILMVVGAFFAGAYDLQFSLFGYLLAGLSCLTQAAAFELGRRVTVSKGVCTTLMINSLCAIGIQCVMVMVTGEIRFLAPSKLNGSILFHFALNSISCLLMNYSVFLNCQVNSPLAHAVVGNVKMFSTTFFGVLFFSTKLLFLGWVGFFANCVGAVWFSAVRLRQHQKEKWDKEKGGKQSPLLPPDEEEASAGTP